MKKENFFDALSSYPYLIGSYGFFADSYYDLESRYLIDNKRYFGCLQAINFEDPFKRFILNGKAYSIFYKVDNYIPKVIEIE